MPTREFKLAELLQSGSMQIYPLMERVLFFKGVELFKNIETEKLLAVAEIASEISFKSGEIITQEGEIGDSLFVVKRGSIKVVKKSQGRNFVLQIGKPGQIFGEMGLWGDHEREAGAIANEECVLLMIKKSEFKRVLMENPEIMYNILEIFSERLRESNKTILLLNARMNKDLLST